MCPRRAGRVGNCFAPGIRALPPLSLSLSVFLPVSPPFPSRFSLSPSCPSDLYRALHPLPFLPSPSHHPSFLLSGLLPLTAPFEAKKRFWRQVDSRANYAQRYELESHERFSMKGRGRAGKVHPLVDHASAVRPFWRPIGQRVSGETIARREAILCTRASHLPSDFPVQAVANDRVTDPSPIPSPTRDVHPQCAVRSTSLSPRRASASLRKRVNGVFARCIRARQIARPRIQPGATFVRVRVLAGDPARVERGQRRSSVRPRFEIAPSQSRHLS